MGQTVDEINKIMPGFQTVYDKESLNENSLIHRTDYSDFYENREKFMDIGGAVVSGFFNENSKFVVDSSIYNSETVLSFAEDADGLHKLTWWFFDNKLYGFTIYYMDYEPPTARSFIKQLAEKTNLPETGWLATDKSNIGAVLKCNGFKVSVHIAYRNSANVTVTDTNVEAEVMRLEKEIKQQKKEEEQERIRLERKKKNTLKP